ncbi:ABC transporter substrate-binding protein [Streptomyces lycii]|uniref:ABC transporter substrate-binding protein n=2 Tax=Streptomyces TaxID=1883 RepID=A0ABQ7FIB7_9ACTN|nr:ABC transporter substrate-binding protein [Streptomyces lycii]KAF4407359.1 ABC transporter substrate-binding protein [Streptomyces lycii]
MNRARTAPPSRRSILAGAAALGAGTLLTACGGGKSDGSDASGGGSGSWSFKDDRGTTVKADGVPEKIVAFIGSAAALKDYGIECTGVFGPTKAADGKPDVQAGEVDIDKVTVLGNAWGEFNVEKYAGLQPELLISNMFEKNTLWYVPEESKKKITALAPSIGISTVGVSLTTPIRRYAQLAESLGADLKSEKATADKKRFEEASARLRRAAKAAGGIKVLACSGSPDLFYASTPSGSADLTYFKELGVDLVEPDNPDEGGFFESLSWENADKYKADILFLDNRSSALQPKALAKKPTWAKLPAVEAGQVVGWSSEPRYSYAGCAPLIEQLAKAIEDAKKIV